MRNNKMWSKKRAKKLGRKRQQRRIVAKRRIAAQRKLVNDFEV